MEEPLKASKGSAGTEQSNRCISSFSILSMQVAGNGQWNDKREERPKFSRDIIFSEAKNSTREETYGAVKGADGRWREADVSWGETGSARFVSYLRIIAT
jgi:hypothetical protein